MRSKAHGGTRFVRESAKPSTKKPTGKVVKPLPGEISTAEDYERAYDDFDDFIDDGELGSGIDYGEEE
jgi:hypothetical protein